MIYLKHLLECLTLKSSQLLFSRLSSGFVGFCLPGESIGDVSVLTMGVYVKRRAITQNTWDYDNGKQSEIQRLHMPS